MDGRWLGSSPALCWAHLSICGQLLGILRTGWSRMAPAGMAHFFSSCLLPSSRLAGMCSHGRSQVEGRREQGGESECV